VIAATVQPLTDGDVLGLLLGVEGFLFAAITLSVTLGSPNQPARRFESLNPDKILLGAVVTLAVISLGAASAWVSLFRGRGCIDVSTAVEAGALLVAIVAQPVFAFLLTLASLD
jgi:hypothetical protein